MNHHSPGACPWTFIANACTVTMQLCMSSLPRGPQISHISNVCDSWRRTKQALLWEQVFVSKTSINRSKSRRNKHNKSGFHVGNDEKLQLKLENKNVRGDERKGSCLLKNNLHKNIVSSDAIQSTSLTYRAKGQLCHRTIRRPISSQ